MKRLLALVVVVAGCHKSLPAYDDKLVAPQVKGLKVGTSTLEDVVKVVPQGKVTKDQSLGGEGTVSFNDQKAISVSDQGFEAYIVDGKLANFTMTVPGACGWLIQTMDGMAGATACPGNRKTGKSKAGDNALYCASAGGRTVWIECSKGEHEYIEYTLGK
jgi:hypothetical protein